jgi:hypothetical protein
MGRKAKKLFEDLPKDWEETVFKIMGEGKPRESVLVEFDLSRAQNGRFMKDHPEWKDAIEKGELLREKYIHEQILKAAVDKEGYKGNTTALMIVVKNVLGWRSEPFQKEKENILADKTGAQEIREQFKKKEKDDEKTDSGSRIVN